jgi:acyl-coenzyme A thioesterase 13
MDARQGPPRLARMSAVPEGFQPFRHSSPFLDRIGPLYERTDAHGLTLGVRVEPWHCNRRGLCHGGLMVTLGDIVLGYTAGPLAEPGSSLTTVHLSTDFAGGAGLGDWLEARADVQKTGGSLAFANAYISNNGLRIVRISGVFKVAKRNR